MSKPPLRSAFTDSAAKRAYNRRLFGTIADRYDFITRFLSFGRDRFWKQRLIEMAGIHTGARVLDLACGTGDLALAARGCGGRVVGLDLAPRMIELARGKPGARAVDWLVGDMTHLPFSDSSCDVVTTGYGLRNVPDLQAAVAEIHRVLAPGGVACSLDFDRPERAWLRWIYLSYLTVIGSTTGWCLHGDPDTYRYIPASIRQYPGSRAVAELFRNAGFTEVEVVPVLGGLMAIHRVRK